VGLSNYAAVLGSETIWGAFTSTGQYVALAVACEFLLGLGLALLLNRRFPGVGLLTTILLLPMMVAPAIASAFWTRMIFHPQGGLLNYYFLVFGMTPPDWFSDARLAVLTLVAVDVWQWTPFMLLLSLAGLTAVPRYLYEAAEIDQASSWFKFRQITLPTIWPLLVVALIFRTMDAVRIFEHQWVASGFARNTATVSTVLYGLAFRDWDTGLSSALACVVAVFAFAMTGLWVRFLAKATAR
jgi:multiple sugar transport system permease protein